MAEKKYLITLTAPDESWTEVVEGKETAEELAKFYRACLKGMKVNVEELRG